MKVVFSRAARAQLRAIQRYISEDNTIRAKTFVSELAWSAMTIADNPKAWPVLPSFAGEKGYRRRLHKNYAIFFFVEPDGTVQILHILNTRQDYERILFPQE